MCHREDKNGTSPINWVWVAAHPGLHIHGHWFLLAARTLPPNPRNSGGGRGLALGISPGISCHRCHSVRSPKDGIRCREEWSGRRIADCFRGQPAPAPVLTRKEDALYQSEAEPCLSK